MTFNYQVSISDPTNAGGNADAVLQADMQAALGVYAQYLGGTGTLKVQINVDATAEGREDGGPTATYAVGRTSGGVSIYQSDALKTLITGVHAASSDITIDIDPGYMKLLDLDSALAPGDSVPYNLYNPAQVFLHELTHGFGMFGWYSQTGTSPGFTESVFDTLIVKNADGTASFVGANAEAAYGGPVPITTSSTAGENYYHFSNTLSDFNQLPTTVTNPLSLDLMNGVVFFFDYNYGVSKLDLAVLKDLGYTVTGTIMAPVVAHATPTEYVPAGVTYQTMPLVAGTFTDPNAQALTYSATLAGGGALPSWLSFVPSAATLIASPPSTGEGVVAVTITATNRDGLGTSETFDVAYGGTSANIAIYEPAGATNIKVIDSAATVSSDLDALEKLAAAKSLQSIMLTDSGVPTLSVTAMQLTSDQAAINDISGAFTLTVTASPGGSAIAGVQGEATIVAFSGTASQYGVTPAGDGTSFTISGNGTTDHVSGVQALAFSDHTDFVASQTPAIAGGVSSAEVANLYSAVFARTPDTLGLAYYENIAATNSGVGILTFAQWFLASPEYTGNSAHNYAQNAIGDGQFIADTYNNLLHRAPEDGAVAFYLNVINPMLAGLTPGTAAYAKADLVAHATVIAYFSQSPEFLGDVTITAQNPASAQHWLQLV